MLQHKCEVLNCPSTYPIPGGQFGGYPNPATLPEGWYHTHPAPPTVDGIPLHTPRPDGLITGLQLPRLVCPKHVLPAYDGTRGLLVRCGALECDATAEAGHIDALPPGWTLIVQGLEEVIPDAVALNFTTRGAPDLPRPKLRKMLYLALCPAHPQPVYEPLPEPEPYLQLSGCFGGHPH